MSYFDLSVMSNYLHCYYTCMLWNYASGLHCWQIFIFTYAYALIFIHRRFGSLFWLLGVLNGYLFHKKIGSLSHTMSHSLGALISFGVSANGYCLLKPNLTSFVPKCSYLVVPRLALWLLKLRAAIMLPLLPIFGEGSRTKKTDILRSGWP